jgi:hypothetical protein
MSTNDQRGATAPGTVGGAVPGTTIPLPSDLTRVEPTKVDEATQQGTSSFHIHTGASVPPSPGIFTSNRGEGAATSDRCMIATLNP